MKGRIGEASVRASGDAATGARRTGLAVYICSVFGLVALVILSGLEQGDWSRVRPTMALFWLAACATSNLLPVPVTKSVQVTMSSPVNLAIAYLFPPSVAAAMVAAASLTEWEVRRETTVLRAAFNRAQLALATVSAALVFRIDLLPGVPGWLSALLAIFLYHVTNVALVATAERLSRGIGPSEIMARMLSPLPSFILSYATLGWVGIALANTYDSVGWWAVAPLIIPLLSARYGLRHFKQLEQAERERRALADKLIDERERERARIASDIHDVVLQSLAAVQLQADNIQSCLEAGSAHRAKKLAGTVKGQIAAAIVDLREAIADLRRSGLDEDDLPKTLDRYARSFHAESGIEVLVDADSASGPDIPLPVALLLYECCQEALTNVAQHAQATRVHVRLGRMGDALELKISDNGRGLSRAKDDRPRLGLTLTRDKVTLVGGGVWFEGRQEGGTELIVRVPLKSVH